MHVDVDSFLPATDEEKKYMVQMRPSSTFFRDGVKRLLKNPVATASLIIIIIITLASIIRMASGGTLIIQDQAERQTPFQCVIYAVLQYMLCY